MKKRIFYIRVLPFILLGLIVLVFLILFGDSFFEGMRDAALNFM